MLSHPLRPHHRDHCSWAIVAWQSLAERVQDVGFDSCRVQCFEDSMVTFRNEATAGRSPLKHIEGTSN